MDWPSRVFLKIFLESFLNCLEKSFFSFLNSKTIGAIKKIDIIIKLDKVVLNNISKLPPLKLFIFFLPILDIL